MRSEPLDLDAVIAAADIETEPWPLTFRKVKFMLPAQLSHLRTSAALNGPSRDMDRAFLLVVFGDQFDRLVELDPNTAEMKLLVDALMVKYEFRSPGESSASSVSSLNNGGASRRTSGVTTPRISRKRTTSAS